MKIAGAVLIILGLVTFIGGSGFADKTGTTQATEYEWLLYRMIYHCANMVSSVLLFCTGCIVFAVAPRRFKAWCPSCCEGVEKEAKVCAHCGTAYQRAAPPETQR